ncbi:S10 family peptidase [Oecophyllibacter saccharovorans]|uniref:Peptidase S10 n=1 Tax=Oecophyllibacter saccharovorans TaxID=2558360 RepID=A0A506UR46_9PROT|nr:peptidase S10 [Oecophyllibacter saccharovorans]TPW35772.1 peptidase S10 [Oecophyllibacter saccharovorans]
MRPLSRLLFSSALTLCAVPAFAMPVANNSGETAHPQPDSVTTTGTLKVNGKAIAYHAVAGTLLVHGRKYDDSRVVLKQRGDLSATSGPEQNTPGKASKDGKENGPIASMFYTAYFRDNANTRTRPLVFLYNGGPGSASVWLQMGSFGPWRVSTPGVEHQPPPPYALIANPQSLLDVADLVFIDAPGTGYSRIGGKKAEKEFYGIDGDAAAFTHFIMAFLAKYHRFESPRYLFGESYGTLRSALVANELEQEEGIDLNGVILLSQILSYDNNADTPQFNPGNDEPYVLSLPTYAATAWYHHRLPQRPDQLAPFLREVEQFASTDYLLALQEGSLLPEPRKRTIAERLHHYTGLPAAYLLRANLRVNGGMFTHQLEAAEDTTTGRLDTRFAGPSLDPMSKEAEYDPQSSALSSAYLSSFNAYVRNTLHYGGEVPYRVFAPGANEHWDTHHSVPLPGGEDASITPNVMPDLAMAMKTNPTLKIMLNSGLFDLATPYYQAQHELHHLPIPDRLQANISTYQYPTGHMVYVDAKSLQALHDNVAAFIAATTH